MAFWYKVQLTVQQTYLYTMESLKFMGYTFQMMAYADIFVLFHMKKKLTHFLSKRM